MIIDSDSITLTHGNSGTTSTGAYQYNISVVSDIATVVISHASDIGVVAAEALIDGVQYRNTATTSLGVSRIITLAALQDTGGTDSGGDNSVAPNIVSTVQLNSMPTLTSFADAVATTNEDSEVEITFNDLTVQGDEADTDGVVSAFIIQSVSSGSLKIGASQATATAFAVGVNDTIDAVNKAYWTPVPNVNGSMIAAFTVKAQDDVGGVSDNAVEVDVNVTSINDVPIAQASSVTTNEDTPHVFSLNEFGFSDVDTGDTLQSITIVFSSISGNGQLKYNGTIITADQVILAANIGLLSYEPDGENAEVASFDFLVNDGTVDSSNQATMSINVTAVNDTPEAQASSVTTNEDTPHVFSLNEFGFSDVDTGDTLQSITVIFSSISGNGQLKYNGTVITANQVVLAANIGLLSYEPDGQNAEVASFNFFVNDGLVDSETSYTMTIDVTAVNDAPVAQDGVVSTNEDTTHIFSLNEFGFSDVDTGDTLQSITVVYSSISGNGQLKYNGMAITADQVVLAANIGLLSYEPDGENAEVASFDFLVNDGTVDSDAPATMTINVTAINDIPVAQASSVTTNEDTTHVFSLNEFGFSDVDTGDTLQSITVVFSSISGNGQLKYNGTTITADQVVLAANIGLLSYEPDAEDAETASFDFLVNDGFVDSANQATMMINVTAVNDPPVAINSAIITNEDSNYTFNLNDFDFTDVENDTLSSVTITSLPANGTLKVNGSAVVLGTNNTVTLAQLVAGELVFEPVADEHGAPYTSFNFSVNDGVDNSNIATMTIDVTSVNDAPTLTNFVDAIVSTNEDTEVEISLAQLLAQGNEADIDGTVDGFVVQALTSGTLKIGATQATATAFVAGTNDTIDATNKAYWTPALNVNGNAIAAFTVKAQDNEGLLSSTAVQATVDVLAVNDAPVAINSLITINEDSNGSKITSRFCH